MEPSSLCSEDPWAVQALVLLPGAPFAAVLSSQGKKPGMSVCLLRCLFQNQLKWLTCSLGFPPAPLLVSAQRLSPEFFSLNLPA